MYEIIVNNSVNFNKKIRKTLEWNSPAIAAEGSSFIQAESMRFPDFFSLLSLAMFRAKNVLFYFPIFCYFKR